LIPRSSGQLEPLVIPLAFYLTFSLYANSNLLLVTVHYLQKNHRF
jgi:hypothetical protein